jgi:hypothetical protein
MYFRFMLIAVLHLLLLFSCVEDKTTNSSLMKSSVLTFGTQMWMKKTWM